jgi:hypothetical protein
MLAVKWHAGRLLDSTRLRLYQGCMLFLTCAQVILFHSSVNDTTPLDGQRSVGPTHKLLISVPAHPPAQAKFRHPVSGLPLWGILSWTLT